MENTVTNVDVVVVGAGLAGLAAARRLKAAHRSVVVLEARDRVGGRTMNHRLHDGSVVEVGGQWIGPGQTAVADLARELGIATHATHTAGKRLLEYRGRIHRYRGAFPLIASPALAEGCIALKRLERMSRSVSPAAPWSAFNAIDWDGQTLRSWTQRSVRSAGGRSLVQLVCEAVFAASPDQVSLLHVLTYIASAGGIDVLIDTVGGAQERRVVGGSQRLALEMVAGFNPDELRMSEPVHHIEYTDSGVTVTSANDVVRARQVVVALSPSLAGRIGFQPALPADRDALTQRAPNGSVIKVMAVYPTAFWRSNGLSGEAILLDGPLKIVYDNSPLNSSLGVLLSFFEGDSAREASTLWPDQRSAILLDTLARIFGPEARKPIELVEKDWSAEQFTRGCYGAVMPPNAWTSVGSALRTPVGPIHWASAETAETWMGYMDGAIRSGHHAADQIIAAVAATTETAERTVLSTAAPSQTPNQC